MTLTQTDLQSIKSTLQPEFDKVRSESKAEFDKVRSESKAEFDKVRAESRSEIAKLRSESLHHFAVLKKSLDSLKRSNRKDHNLIIDVCDKRIHNLEDRVTILESSPVQTVYKNL